MSNIRAVGSFVGLTINHVGVEWTPFMNLKLGFAYGVKNFTGRYVSHSH